MTIYQVVEGVSPGNVVHQQSSRGPSVVSQGKLVGDVRSIKRDVRSIRRDVRSIMRVAVLFFSPPKGHLPHMGGILVKMPPKCPP